MHIVAHYFGDTWMWSSSATIKTGKILAYIFHLHFSMSRSIFCGIFWSSWSFHGFACRSLVTTSDHLSDINSFGVSWVKVSESDEIHKNSIRWINIAHILRLLCISMYTTVVLLPTDAACCPDINIEDVVLLNKIGEIAENTAYTQSFLV